MGGKKAESVDSEGSVSEGSRRSDGIGRKIADTIAALRGFVRTDDRAVDQRYEPKDLGAFSPPALSEEVRDHSARTEMLDDVVDHFETADLPFEQRPDPEAVRSRFFDFSYLDRYEEIERYWVNEPYAYVTVARDRSTDERSYLVVEPYLSRFEKYVLDELTKVLRNSLMYQDVTDDEQKARLFEEHAADLVGKHTAAVTQLSLYKLLYYLRRDFIEYGRIDPIMHDQSIEDISCDGGDLPVFVYHREYRDLDTNVMFGQAELTSFVARMAQRAGKHISVSNPLVDASLPDGSRVQLSFGGDIATRGANFTIRHFSAVPDTPVDLINWDTFSIQQMAYFWLAIENNRSLVFAGGTGSGKTTSLNAVSFFIPKKSKVVSIEDTPEIKLPHDNWIQSLTRESVTTSGQGEVTMYQQLQSALRQRPEYILVGEIRTELQVALTFFQAMATGHAAYTTLHSESVKGVIDRMENEPLSVPIQMLKELDIISIQRQVMVDGERVRRNENVTELVGGGEGDDIRANQVFSWDAANDTYNDLVDSSVFEDIAADRGWSRKRTRQEFEKRQEVLEYLVEEDITWHEDVARVIHGFMNSPDLVIDRVREGTLDPKRIGAIISDDEPEEGLVDETTPAVEELADGSGFEPHPSDGAAGADAGDGEPSTDDPEDREEGEET